MADLLRRSQRVFGLSALRQGSEQRLGSGVQRGTARGCRGWCPHVAGSRARRLRSPLGAAGLGLSPAARGRIPPLPKRQIFGGQRAVPVQPRGAGPRRLAGVGCGGRVWLHLLQPLS